MDSYSFVGHPLPLIRERDTWKVHMYEEVYFYIHLNAGIVLIRWIISEIYCFKIRLNEIAL